MKLALINPPLLEVDLKNDKIIDYDQTGEKFPVCSSITLEQIATHSGLEHSDILILKAYTLNISKQNILNSILNFKPTHIGYSCTNISINTAMNFSEDISRILPDSIHIFGGYFPSLLGEELFNQCPTADYVVIGDGENTIKELLKRKKNSNKQVITSKEYPFDFENSKKPIRTHTIDEIKLDYTPGIQSSRGCTYNSCSFCSVAAVNKKINRKWEARSAESVIDEIIELREISNIRHAVFVDEDFIGNKPERAIKILSEIYAKYNDQKFYFDLNINQVDKTLLKELMKYGLEGVFIGIESFSDTTLNLYCKGYSAKKAKKKIEQINNIGLSYVAGFMPFNPQSCFETISNDIKIGLELGITDITRLSHQLVLSFGTPLYKKFNDQTGDFILDYNFKDQRIELLKNKLIQFKDKGKQNYNELIRYMDKIGNETTK
jgi:radical SAM superfamily enzyme YgiQ (UPF0313 family)